MAFVVYVLCVHLIAALVIARMSICLLPLCPASAWRSPTVLPSLQFLTGQFAFGAEFASLSSFCGIGRCADIHLAALFLYLKK